MPAAEQTPAEIAILIQNYLAEHEAAVVLDEGRVVFQMSDARFSLSQEHGRCTLHLWSEDRNMVRRVVGAVARKDALRIGTLKFGQTKPQTLELLPRMERRTPTERDTVRKRYTALLERVLARNFPDDRLDRFRSAMDLERSFGPAYTRGVLQRGQGAWAVVGVGESETAATVDGILTVGILWLQQCREQAEGRRVFHGLRLIVPQGMGAVTLARLAWMHPQIAQWEMYELDERTEELHLRDLRDTGNLETRLQHLPDIAAAEERFADAVARALEVVPEGARASVERRLRSSTEMTLGLHGLVFARIRQSASANSFARESEITFGAGRHETPLDDSTEPLLRELVRELFTGRQPHGSANHPLYRMHPEAWLESELRRNIGPLTDGQSGLAQFDPAHVYAQVPAFSAGDRGMLDLLTLTRDGRLAVLELKADEDMHFALQGLDYWLRVRWHHVQTVDSSTGLGTFHRHGYFTDVRLSPEPPRLYLVAPSMRVHPATETVLRYLKPEVEWTLLGLSEHWRRKMKVVFRKRSGASV